MKQEVNANGSKQWSLSNKVTLTSYVGTLPSLSNAYTFPSDGILLIQSGSSSSASNCQGSLFDENGENRMAINMVIPSGQLTHHAIPVCKGMKYMITQTPSNCAVYFYPYIN